ncbi:sensor histidine kinase RegB [uncultured Roseovarius sp.]|uniref:sensor histidine kinase RegB n=1 Tax=uncultured Roseovarius sp. TaxID=293344 RepID=UPI002635D03A|nr:ActS/PrrB/RegB family redox-sensitive histidine kinase [uncultured Roseovarius sp.]
MADHDTGLFKSRERGNWIRLRTLVVLRWWAIVGQASALIIADRVYHLNLEMGLCFLVIGVSVASNLVAGFVFAENKRLSEQDTLLVVLFDMLQLGLLLYLTGGLHNPFSILIVGPVTVSASALSGRSTAFLGMMALVIVTLLMQFYLPLRTEEGFVLRVPYVFLLGNWVAIVIAVLFLGVYSRWIVQEMQAMSDAVQATQMALAREQKLTDLGGVVAAAAHELGTPLATIKLTSAELAEELADDPELRDDALLIREQADRCRDILRSMGRAGKDDLHLRRAPLTTLIEEAAEPHVDRGKRIHFDHGTQDPVTQPTVLRRPEVIHGLRNLIQNAVDFARENVWIESGWDDSFITLRIVDDGRGFPPDMLGRIGDPFIRRRAPVSDPQRPEYEGMGLGLFIAKTLLERSGADLTFANGSEPFQARADHAARSGALVEVTWPRAVIEVAKAPIGPGLGQNQPIRG